MTAECDHKGHKVICPSSAGPCCEGCGEPWPYEDKKPQADKLPSRQSIDDTVDKCLRIWFGNYDKMDEADKDIYRAPMREIVLSIAVSHPDPSVAVKALQEISSLGFVAVKDAPQAHDEVVKIAREALSAQSQGVATYRHKARRSEYTFIGVGKMQAEGWHEEILGSDEDGRNAWVNESIDMREVAIYRSVDDGSLWVRPVEEFNDGRFEKL